MDRPLGLQEVWLPEFLANRQMNMDRLSAVLTGLLYPPEIFMVLIYITG
jgi:hypothetical protein